MTPLPLVYLPPARVSEGSESPLATLDAWRTAWLSAYNHPEGYWLEQSQRLQWHRPPTRGLDGSYRTVHQEPFAWFSDGLLNVAENCVDRHLAVRRHKTALLWQGDEPDEVRRISYGDLHARVCQAAHALEQLGLRRGERAVIYMGMVPEAAIAMLACARIGAVHSVVFGGFSAESLRDRIRDCGADLVITQDEGRRGGRSIPLKTTVDAALEGEHSVRKVLVYRRTGTPVAMRLGRDEWWHDVVDSQPTEHHAQPVEAEHPLFILYTSGSTGRPKGLVHTSGGYLTYAAYTHQMVFDLREDDVYACMADVGWITGHSYIVYGPLANGATTLLFESVPTYPDASRYWEVVERHGVTILYTAPTALRALAAHGEAPVRKHNTSSLRVLGTVGEPINPAAWEWYYHVVGQGRCAVVDTWWQTETGGICISPIAPATPTPPGAATLPLPGILPLVLDADGHILRGPSEGLLCLGMPWPGQARTVWGDHERYVVTYFSTFKGLYFTGDGCRRDAQGNHWITGRVDDVINVSGHRMGTAEFESALVAHEAVAEAAVVGYPHSLKGQGVHAYVVLQPSFSLDVALEASLQRELRQHIGAHARVDRFQAVPGLPKTRSGKVMRRILRKVAEGEPNSLGDVTTLADPSVVQDIIEGAAGFTLGGE